jgi:hypothetical protein
MVLKKTKPISGTGVGRPGCRAKRSQFSPLVSGGHSPPYGISNFTLETSNSAAGRSAKQTQFSCGDGEPDSSGGIRIFLDPFPRRG